MTTSRTAPPSAIGVMVKVAATPASSVVGTVKVTPGEATVMVTLAVWLPAVAVTSPVREPVNVVRASPPSLVTAWPGVTRPSPRRR